MDTMGIKSCLYGICIHAELNVWIISVSVFCLLGPTNVEEPVQLLMKDAGKWLQSSATSGTGRFIPHFMWLKWFVQSL